MLVGEYRHTLDVKKRLAIPAKFRKDLGNRVVLTRGLDACLFLYPERSWMELADRLGKLPTGQAGTRSFVRLMLAGAAEAEVDRLGRILVPEYLRAYATLGRKVVLAGLFNRVEIWDEALWREYQKRSEQNASEIAEKLGEIGAY
ncbi:MAG: division/cell wall cluster transcriptional repressor MraZ [Candidatus Terrybacteria bacterium]|nr:division/cell wall cluster transcriptional repressor MraZ [Candidatus Terrybacteria bacterium]